MDVAGLSLLELLLVEDSEASLDLDWALPLFLGAMVNVRDLLGLEDRGWMGMSVYEGRDKVVM